MKMVTLATLIIAAAAAVSMLWLFPRENGAQASTTTTIGIDVDPTGSSAVSLGPVDTCVQVSAGSTFQVDVFIDGILPVNQTPNVEDVAGYNYFFTYPVGWTVEAKDHLSYFLSAATGSGAFDALSDAAGESDGSYIAVVSDLGTAETCGDYCEGVLGRYTLAVPAGTTSDVYELALSSVKVKNSQVPPKDQFDPPRDWGVGADNDSDGAIDEDLILDGNSGYGLVAVGVPCPAATPLPTGTPTPGLSPTPALSPTPGLSPTPAPGELTQGWNYVCHLGPEEPIEDGLAGIAQDVLAVYRLAGSGGYDGWFPDRPDISTITTLHPYDALFISMANPNSWVRQPSEPPLTSVGLTQGWNGVCYSGQTKETAIATASISEKVAVAYVLAPTHAWQRFVPGRSDISDLGELGQFTAILLLVSDQEGAQWTFDP
jgi:hypothetical protein